VLLTTQTLEEPLTRVLLEMMVEMCQDEVMANKDDQDDSQERVPLQQLIIIQLQVLDNGNCSDEVVSLLLEAFASLPPNMQASMASVVGEMVPQNRSEGVY
jgi:hypothetical protein